MNRLTLPAVLMATLLVVSVGAVGAVAAPLASTSATAATMQEGDGNTTTTPTPSASGTESTDATATNGNSGEPPAFGTVVSSFMQTSAADAENEVEDGLFAAQFERSNASERARMVRQRTSNIGARIAELREERAQLLDDGNATVRDRAEAARLSEQADGLSGSIEQTEAAAQRANVQLNATALDELRSEARNLTGPEVAELARGLVDRDETPRRGPPEDRGPGSDATDSVSNETATTEPVADDRGSDERSGPNGTDGNETADSERTPRSGNGSNDDSTDDSQQSDGTDDDGTPTATPTSTSTDDGTDGY